MMYREVYSLLQARADLIYAQHKLRLARLADRKYDQRLYEGKVKSAIDWVYAAQWVMDQGRNENKMQHKITTEDIGKYIANHWVHLAFSSSADGCSRKKLEGTLTGLFKVTDHDTIIYIGVRLETAIEEYNKLP